MYKRQVIIGSGPDAFSDPIRGAESARFLLGRGVDVIYQVAGASGIGVINAVREAGKGFAIGVDSNQNGLAPGRVLTGMLKRVDLAVLEAVQEQLSGKFAPGVVRVGIEKGRRPEEDFVGYMHGGCLYCIRITIWRVRGALRGLSAHIGDERGSWECDVTARF